MALTNNPAAAGACVDDIWKTDNTNLYVHYHSSMDAIGSAAMKAAATRALTDDPLFKDYDAATDLIVHLGADLFDIQDVFHQVYTFECGLNWLPLAPPDLGDLKGLTECLTKFTSGPMIGRCDKAQVRFDAGSTILFGADSLQSLACHEFGHAVGLFHRQSTQTCMKTGALDALYPGDHEINDNDMINDSY